MPVILDLNLSPFLGTEYIGALKVAPATILTQTAHKLNERAFILNYVQQETFKKTKLSIFRKKRLSI